MDKANKQFLGISPQEKTKFINALIAYFHDERDEEIGYIAAEELLDFFLDALGKDIYNKAVKDCKKLVKERSDDILLELDIISDEK